MTKFLIAGLGSIGRRHLRNLIALGENDVVLLRSHRSTLPDEELAGFAIETDLAQALEKHRPAAVIVSNPTALHLDIAIPAAEAGCTILLEKPISQSLDRLELLEGAVSRTNARVLVGFQLRYHPCLVRARQFITDARLGQVLSSRVHFGEYLPAWHPWEDYRQSYAARADLGGGVLLTQCHSLDYLPWLIGRAESVWGFLGKLSELDVDVEDSAEIGVRFEDGCLGSLHLDYAQQPASHRVEICGTHGSLLCDLLAGTTRFYDVATKKWEEFALPHSWERNVMFIEEMGHFLAVVRGEAEPACTLDDGMRVMRLIAAIRASNSSGRRVSLRS
ncbi:MAG: Gfo/Idh/MocA family oxidoreductase [Chloroflexota bacterium]